LASILNQLFYEEGPEIADSLLNQLEKMTPEAIAAFTQTLSIKGLEAPVDEFNNEFQTIADQMSIGSNSINDFLAFWSNFIQEIKKSSSLIEE
jgi:hypothetical protein